MTKRKIAILIDSAVLSGGINVVFQHALGLAINGYSVTFVSPARIDLTSVMWHPISVHYNHQNIKWSDYWEIGGEHFDIAIATWWRTFYDLWRVEADSYAFFVQSIESRFYGDNELILRSTVDATYEMPLGIITEAKWIKDYLFTLYGTEAELVPNGIDKNIFCENGNVYSPRELNKLRILIEGPIDVPFKNVKKTINICRKTKADEIWLLTSSDINAVKGVDRVFSRIPFKETPAVYRSCDVVVKLSYVEGMFGPPLEMFHCGGTAIVYSVTGFDEYIKHGENGLVAKIDDEATVIQYINDLKEFPCLLDKLKKGAALTAQEWINWDESSRRFADALDACFNKPNLTRKQLENYSRRIWCNFEMSTAKLDSIMWKLVLIHKKIATKFPRFNSFSGKAARYLWRRVKHCI